MYVVSGGTVNIVYIVQLILFIQPCYHVRCYITGMNSC